jgi:transposase
VATKREAFLKDLCGVDPTRLVFLDEAGANIAMGRSHAWVMRGEEFVEPRPMNWGDNLTLIGAVRSSGWVTLGTRWGATTKVTFTAWVRDRLAPKLRRGDIVLLDNLKAHKAPAVRAFIEARGATLKFLPPYSHDFNPIEPVWALVKKDIRMFAPRSADALRRVARAARYVVRPDHCQRFFAHAGYVNSSAWRD